MAPQGSTCAVAQRPHLEKCAQHEFALGFPLRAAEFYGSIHATLESEGHTIGNNDLWIAAHAKAAGLILVTNNERGFRRVQGLEIENWAN